MIFPASVPSVSEAAARGKSACGRFFFSVFARRAGGWPGAYAAPRTFHAPYASHAPRIVLRRSAGLQAALVAGLCVAVAATCTGLARWPGAQDARLAWPATFALVAAGGLALAAWRRRQPNRIEFPEDEQYGPDSLAVFSRAGACIASGRLVGGARWGDWLLVLAIDTERGRRTLLIAADAATRSAFRELAVRSRIAAGRA